MIKPALDSMGVAQGSAGVVTVVGSDTSTAQTQLASYIEKWKGEGVDAIILVGQYVPAKEFVEQIKAAMPNVLLLTDGASSAEGGGQDEASSGRKPNPYDGMLTANGLTDEEVWQSAGLQQCVRTTRPGAASRSSAPTS